MYVVLNKLNGRKDIINEETGLIVHIAINYKQYGIRLM